MNYAVLPPELNSLRMFTGAGSAPMLAAAVAWDGLAAELGSAASSFGSVTSDLASQAWQGPINPAEPPLPSAFPASQRPDTTTPSPRWITVQRATGTKGSSARCTVNLAPGPHPVVWNEQALIARSRRTAIASTLLCDKGTG